MEEIYQKLCDQWDAGEMEMKNVTWYVFHLFYMIHLTKRYAIYRFIYIYIYIYIIKLVPKATPTGHITASIVCGV